MSIESAIEQMIQQAMARGEFDNLKGKGEAAEPGRLFQYARRRPDGLFDPEIQ
jgi:hypothetical protein